MFPSAKRLSDSGIRLANYTRWRMSNRAKGVWSDWSGDERNLGGVVREAIYSL